MSSIPEWHDMDRPEPEDKPRVEVRINGNPTGIARVDANTNTVYMTAGKRPVFVMVCSVLTPAEDKRVKANGYPGEAE